MRKIDELVWHCTATPEGREVSVDEVRRWHLERGWEDIGYHALVHLDGSVSKGRPIAQQGAHVYGRNRHTIGYAYVGGLDTHGNPKDTRTAAQKHTMRRLTMAAIRDFDLSRVSGHRDYAAKACPCFDAGAEYMKFINAPLMPEADPIADRGELSDSRTISGAGTGAVGTVGAVAAETAEQIEPFAYVSTILKFAFIALTLIGIGYVLYARWDDAGRPKLFRKRRRA